MTPSQVRLAMLALGTATVLAGCLSSNEKSADATGPVRTVETASQAGRVFVIKPGPNATSDMVNAMVQLQPKDVLRFECGFFELTTGMSIANTEDVLIEGCGKDKTFLSFRNSNSQEGFLASNVVKVTVRNLTIGDSPGDAFKLKGVNHGTLQSVRAIWSSGRGLANEVPITAANFSQKIKVACTSPPKDNPESGNPVGQSTSPDYTVSSKSGRYGIYPVESRNILVEEVESIGASDAGIYVGQTTKAKIRKSRAVYNVFGFEIENVQDGEYSDNLAECNTGGFLVYDLDNLTQYGNRSRVFRNVSRNNNTYNFAIPGSIVANVPRGSGLITLAYDKIDIYDNVFENNSTAGIILTSYDLLGENGDRRMDVYSEGVNIFGNTFKNNGNDLPQANYRDIVESQGARVTSAFPMLVGLKNAAAGGGYKGAHIVWDGYQDAINEQCPAPKDKDGKPVPVDEDGKPLQGNQFPNPSCRFNAYKFKADKKRDVPKWWFSCINPTSNKFNADSLTFANFKGTRGLDAVIGLNPSDPAKALTPEFVTAAATNIPNFPSDLDVSKHDCMKQFGAEMKRLPDFEFEPYVPSGKLSPAPLESEIKRLCEVPQKAGLVNEAAATVNCPMLSQYNLFADAQDPRSLPSSRGMPYTLNSKLFTDYAIKHRVIYIPEGKKAQFLADENAPTNANQTIRFPVGTIIAKTFSFVDKDKETPMETRLLIKRVRDDGKPSRQEFWDALEYIWRTDSNGKRDAELRQGGGTGAATFDYVDVDTKVAHKGATSNYLFPNATQCANCHSNIDKETGSSPIGPKPRNMNRVYQNESPLMTGQARHPVAGKNQLKFMCDTGLMEMCPTNFELDNRGVATNLFHMPKFGVPGDSGHPANSKKDIEARAKAFLEANCAHCHNPKGQSSNTGFYVDYFRAVDSTYGICKKPTASGSEGRGNRVYDIHPARSANSILPYRIGPEATTLAAMMPPLGRSLVQREAFDLMNQWIDQVVDNTYANANACDSSSNASGGSPIPLGAAFTPAARR